MARPQCDTPLVRLSFDEFCEEQVVSCYLLETSFVHIVLVIFQWWELDPHWLQVLGWRYQLLFFFFSFFFFLMSQFTSILDGWMPSLLYLFNK